MARKQYKEAAKTAIIIANEEQINGIFCVYITNIKEIMYRFVLQEIIEALMMFYLACIKN